MGTTLEDYQNAFSYALNAYMDGSIKDAELRDLQKRGLLRLKDINDIQKAAKNTDELQKIHFNEESKLLKDALKNTLGDNFPDEFKQNILHQFSEEALKCLTRNNSEYRKDLQALRRKVLIDGIQAAENDGGISTKTWTFFGGNDTAFLGLFGSKNNELGELKEALIQEKKEIEDQPPESPEITQPFISQLKPSDLPLRSRDEIQTASGNINNFNFVDAENAKVKISKKIKLYENEINDAAKTYGVEPELIIAMIQQESGGNSKAVSNKGAQGLMQLMPATAQSLGVTNSFDPKQNINGGVKYIAQQLKAFGGSIEKALWAYNAGPANVRKGRKPKETKGYIKNIMATYNKLKAANKNNAQNITAQQTTQATQTAPKQDLKSYFDFLFAGD